MAHPSSEKNTVTSQATPAAQSANLGFPRIGAQRELKKAVEAYWKGSSSQAELLATAKELRQRHWRWQREAGLTFIPSNDFSFYDHVLDTIAMLGAVPERFHFSGGKVDLDTFFAMARGNSTAVPLEMTKWFDTNYHYLVPEFEPEMTFALGSTKIVDEFWEAKELGILTRPVLLGPLSFLLLGKAKAPTVALADILEKILPVYAEVLERLSRAGAEWVQLDEPCLVLDLPQESLALFQSAYDKLCTLTARPKFCLTAYFASIADKLEAIAAHRFEALHIDLVRAGEQLEKVLAKLPEQMLLSLGVVNGRNIWKTNLATAAVLIDKAKARLGASRLIIAPSCSLLHAPIDVSTESKLAPALKERLAFARQKLAEVATLERYANGGRQTIAEDYAANLALFERVRTSAEIHDPKVQERMASLSETMFRRHSTYAERGAAQEEFLKLPLFPTTTIGSFPQTAQIRMARADYKAGRLSAVEYARQMRAEIERIVRFQEKIGLDVLVHGEPERNDMVEYFGEQLSGFAFTQNGWVQSYGSRCVKPPVIFADVSRPRPMTVDWATYAQSLSERPVKGMLTGPITILQWSFVREDQPRRDTAWQIALAIRDEVADLERAGIRIIQIDEPALREGTPLRSTDWDRYFDWSVKAFRLATSGVSDRTQVHSHMCYSNFNDIMPAIAALDADVISIEASRSDAELLEAFADFDYPNAIGPGVYDIHSPRVPSVEEMSELLRQILKHLDKKQVWVNPDCGLKTRGWLEVEAALQNMVAAAMKLRDAK